MQHKGSVKWLIQHEAKPSAEFAMRHPRVLFSYTCGYKYTGRKYPDHLADFCKRLSVNRMAASSRLSWCIIDFFLLSATFQTYCPNLTSLAGCRTRCPTDQHLCCKALINLKKIKHASVGSALNGILYLTIVN